MIPERISKLASFLRDKEPLMYLFLLNANYKKINGIVGFTSAVSFRNGITLYYSDYLLQMPIEEMYFVLTHEAQHIFKQHLHVFKKQFRNKEDKNDALLANIATDAIINEEIKKFNFKYFEELSTKPVFWNDCVLINQEYKNFLFMNGVSEEDGFTSIRYYNWLKENGYEAESVMSEVESQIIISNGKDSITYKMFESYEFDESDSSGAGENDSQEKGDASKDGEDNDKQSEQETKNMIQRLVKQAKNMEEKLIGKVAGSMARDISIEKKSTINWKKELRKKIRYYVSKNCSKPNKKKSFLTYLMNPKSGKDLIFPHFLKQRDKLETAIIIAVDTSGSCFLSETEMETFFIEVDAIAKDLEKSKMGKVHLMQWEYYVQGDIEEYVSGSFKDLKLKGGGGTRPQSIFDFMDKNAKVNDNGTIFINNGSLNVYAENFKSLPLIIILTDGEFYPFARTGIYKDSKNVLFFTRTNGNIKDDTDFILYK
jgi:predicted metal-dependent peptidase